MQGWEVAATAAVCTVLGGGLSALLHGEEQEESRAEADAVDVFIASELDQPRETLAVVEALTDPGVLERRVVKASHRLAGGARIELLRSPSAPAGVIDHAGEIDPMLLREALALGVKRLDGSTWVLPVAFNGEAFGALRVLGRIDADRIAALRRFADLVASRLEVHRAYRALAENERAAALGQFATALVHDLRSPLSTIRLRLQLAASGLQGELHAHTLEAVAQVDRIDALMSEMLGFASLERATFATTDPSGLLSSLQQRFAPIAAESGVELAFALPPSAPPFVADRSALERALDNLLSNAIAFSPRGGTVWVAADVQPTMVQFCVSDDGPGIPAEDRARVFEPFFTRRPGGTGLGLAVVQRVAQLHDGSVSLQSKAGGGTRAQLQFPLRPPVGQTTLT